MDEAMRRFAVLQPHLEEGVSLIAAARAADVPIRTAQRWLSHYRTDGLDGLSAMSVTICDSSTRIEGCIDLALHPDRVIPEPVGKDGIELLVIDEAERLSTQSLEHIRDIFDRTGIGVILIGMPGLERKLERYPQLYGRIGFAHHYRTLKGDELTFVLTRHWRKLGLQLDDADFTDHQAIASIARITGGNFRLLHRLFVQIERILKINELSLVTDDVVEAARSTLIIGAT
ncbi:AAA family ATPase [Sulfitobacter aestuarii]|uniref:AAA family ATPase n=1 Tax=Sulfitobacter aestuarii TaxID=2161676 RepID=A0ABW5U5I6_9RHOB